MRFDTRSIRIPLLTLALVSAAACARGDDAATTDNVAGGALDTTNTTATFRVTDVELGKGLEADKTVRDATDDFGVRDTIYASVKTEGSATGATLVARWTFQDGAVVQEQSQTINATGDAITEFHIMKDTAWPAGNYKLSILLNGTEVETEDFEIK